MDLIISTKFTPQIASSSKEAMQEMIEGSKSRLHADVIDIYWIHNPMDVEKWTPDLIPLAKSGQIVLSEDEITRLEALADQVGISTLREWEKEMA